MDGDIYSKLSAGNVSRPLSANKSLSLFHLKDIFEEIFEENKNWKTIHSPEVKAEETYIVLYSTTQIHLILWLKVGIL